MGSFRRSRGNKERKRESIICQEKKKGAKATAASMVLEVLKKKNAVNKETALPVDAFKDLKLTTTTLSYTIANLVEEGVVGQTEDGKFYYDDAGFKALETKFVRGYAMIFIIPIAAVILIYFIQFLMR